MEKFEWADVKSIGVVSEQYIERGTAFP